MVLASLPSGVSTTSKVTLSPVPRDQGSLPVMSSPRIKMSPKGSSHTRKPWPNWWLYHLIRPSATSYFVPPWSFGDKPRKLSVRP
jgi:hypothetical protein